MRNIGATLAVTVLVSGLGGAAAATESASPPAPAVVERGDGKIGPPANSSTWGRKKCDRIVWGKVVTDRDGDVIRRARGVRFLRNPTC